MDPVERLTIETAQGDTVLACEHRHRYEFAARLCAGRRVLDLCCGSGYGSAILASQALEVVGVDRDQSTIDIASATLGRHVPGISFHTADAVGYLRRDVAGRFDAVVCFEGLEHLDELEPAVQLLRGLAEVGVALIVSVPNSKLFGEENPHHVTDFGYEDARGLLEGLPHAVVLPQFLAEGSLICPPGARAAEVAVVMDDRDEIDYANHFLCCANFEPSEVERVHHGRMLVSASPVYNRWAEGLKRAIAALESENARLSRAHLGRAGSAAAALLVSEAGRPADPWDAAHVDAASSQADDELDRLRAENATLRRERDILRAAAVLFARDGV